jgi:two-component system, OmpR family, response regulator VicR
MQLLLIEDDQNLGQILREYLEAKGYPTVLCNHGAKAMEVYASASYDMIILDVMLPGKDGFAIAKEIRGIDSSTPIIFLTAKSMKEDTLQGLRIGADDYLTKPFSMEELILRMKAIFRRTQRAEEPNANIPQQFKIGNYTFDYDRQLLSHEDHIQKLTSKETELLKLLTINMNQMLDRTYALKTIWNDDSYFNARSMDVYIAKLRKYLKNDPNVQILTVHRSGFKLVYLKENVLQ